jgi:hypothetical protein
MQLISVVKLGQTLEERTYNMNESTSLVEISLIKSRVRIFYVNNTINMVVFWKREYVFNG